MKFWNATCLLFFACLMLSADELTQVGKAQQDLAAAEKSLAAQKAKAADKNRTAETLEKTAQVTLNPSNRTAVVPPNKAKVIYQNPLSTVNGFKPNKGTLFAIVDTPQGKALKIQSPPGAQSVSRSLRVPEGKRIRVSIWLKGENVVKADQNYFNGTRLGGVLKENGKLLYPAAPASVGTFDWRKVSFETNVPFGSKDIWLTIGLAGATGTVWARDLVVEEL
ncbi:MAG: hypothetical protein PHS41_06060 [Victivallaceae bacterium]|nr:hypothetical protein [Victivallaceae bacterium]